MNEVVFFCFDQILAAYRRAQWSGPSGFKVCPSTVGTECHTLTDAIRPFAWGCDRWHCQWRAKDPPLGVGVCAARTESSLTRPRQRWLAKWQPTNPSLTCSSLNQIDNCLSVVSSTAFWLWRGQKDFHFFQTNRFINLCNGSSRRSFNTNDWSTSVEPTEKKFKSCSIYIEMTASNQLIAHALGSLMMFIIDNPLVKKIRRYGNAVCWHPLHLFNRKNVENGKKAVNVNKSRRRKSTTFFFSWFDWSLVKRRRRWSSVPPSFGWMVVIQWQAAAYFSTERFGTILLSVTRKNTTSVSLSVPSI